MKQDGSGNFLFGPKGAGKTYAAVQIVNALCVKGYRCLVTSFMESKRSITYCLDVKKRPASAGQSSSLFVLSAQYSFALSLQGSSFSNSPGWLCQSIPGINVRI